MTAKQTAARKKFKLAVAEAKKLRKKNPKLSQAQAVKQAFAILYKTKAIPGGKKVGAVKKKAAKKATPKKKAAPKKRAMAKSLHKDTHSHNVNIRVVSGISTNQLSSLQKAISRKENLENILQKIRKTKLSDRSIQDKLLIKQLPKLIKGEKEIITIIKKGIK